MVRTSAIKGDGIQDLLDTLDYQADLLELKADFSGNAEGTVNDPGEMHRLAIVNGELSSRILPV